MSNVVSIGLPKRPSLAQRQAFLIDSFVYHRRAKDDVFWLKENAELLSILNASGARLPPEALKPYKSFYDTIEERMRFFPQYYRFFLSICLDLEDLGFDGAKGALLCEWVRRARLSECELSDLQRAEAGWLLARRGATPDDAALRDRLIRFIGHPSTFVVPNKKASYELTHIIFYVTDYGRSPVSVNEAVVTSLEYAGLLAYLDQDVDLLSEIGLALRFVGEMPSEIWEAWLTEELASFALVDRPSGAIDDSYHEYLVMSWWASASGQMAFPGRPNRGALEIRRRGAARGPLREISKVMYELGAERSSDWGQMRNVLESALPVDQQYILQDAALSSRCFAQFFEGFSRA